MTVHDIGSDPHTQTVSSPMSTAVDGRTGDAPANSRRIVKGATGPEGKPVQHLPGGPSTRVVTSRRTFRDFSRVRRTKGQVEQSRCTWRTGMVESAG